VGFRIRLTIAVISVYREGEQFSCAREEMSRLKRREYSIKPDSHNFITDLPSCLVGKKETIEISRYKIVQLLAEMGLFQHEIALCLNMNEDTFEKHLTVDEKLRTALQLGKRKPDQQVQMSLYQLALGYNFQETTVEEEYIVSSKDGVLCETIIGKKVKKANKHQPANPTAVLFWLKNRLPKVWKDRVEATITLRDRAEMAHRFGT